MFTRRDLTRLIIPLIIEQLLAATIGIADTVMVASVGEAAVSGVSLVDSLNLLLINVFAALATGGAIVAAQYLGRDDEENANLASKQLVLIIAVMSTVIMAACLLSQRVLLRALFGAAEESVMQSAMTYFSLSAASYPFIALYSAFAAIFRVQNNAKIAMFASLVMNVINISGNAFTIFVLGWGVAGAALSSLVARFFGALFLFWLLRNPLGRIHMDTLRPLRFDRKMVGSILRIGVPSGLENGMFHIGKILVQGLIATFGTAAIAANAVANSIMAVANIPGTAIGLALVTVVGQCVGAREMKQAKGYMIKLTGVAYLSMWVITWSIILMLTPVVEVFGLSPEATRGAWQLCICAALGNSIFWPISFALPNGLRSANDVKFTMIVSIISMWVFRVGGSYIIGQALGVGVLGVWIAMVVDWIFRGGMFVWRLFSGRWMHKQFI